MLTNWKHSQSFPQFIIHIQHWFPVVLTFYIHSAWPEHFPSGCPEYLPGLGVVQPSHLSSRRYERRVLWSDWGLFGRCVNKDCQNQFCKITANQCALGKHGASSGECRKRSCSGCLEKWCFRRLAPWLWSSLHLGWAIGQIYRVHWHFMFFWEVLFLSFYFANSMVCLRLSLLSNRRLFSELMAERGGREKQHVEPEYFHISLAELGVNFDQTRVCDCWNSGTTNQSRFGEFNSVSVEFKWSAFLRWVNKPPQSPVVGLMVAGWKILTYRPTLVYTDSPNTTLKPHAHVMSGGLAVKSFGWHRCNRLVLLKLCKHVYPFGTGLLLAVTLHFPPFAAVSFHCATEKEGVPRRYELKKTFCIL